MHVPPAAAIGSTPVPPVAMVRHKLGPCALCIRCGAAICCILPCCFWGSCALLLHLYRCRCRCSGCAGQGCAAEHGAAILVQCPQRTISRSAQHACTGCSRQRHQQAHIAGGQACGMAQGRAVLHGPREQGRR